MKTIIYPKINHTLDADKKKLGRIASEAAILLMGKALPSYSRNRLSEVTVEIINASKLDLDEVKKDERRYARYTGYPGGLKYASMTEVIKKHGHEGLLRKVIAKMLPNNTLRPRMLKFLIIKE